MVSITPQVSSTYHLILKEEDKSELKTISRRVSRRATLDQSSVTTDSGYTETDRTLKVKAKLKEAEWDILQYMLENYSRWNVSTGGEFFSCAPERCKAPGGIIDLTLLVTE